jgi:hypothetical protein
VHNGYVGDFQVIRRDLMWEIDPKLFAGSVGSTDTEVVLGLALTFGLEEDPIRALERTPILGRRRRCNQRQSDHADIRLKSQPAAEPRTYRPDRTPPPGPRLSH